MPQPNLIARLIAVLLLISACGGGGQSVEPTSQSSSIGTVELVSAPMAERIPHTQIIAGVEIEDDYFWLRDRENPEVIAYLEAENAYTDAMMTHTARAQEQLYEEMLSHIQETDLSVPYPDGDFLYYWRTEEGLDYPIFCREAPDSEDSEEVLLDENLLAEGHEYLEVGIRQVSPDHRLLAYGVDTTGSERYELRFRDLETGEDRPETLEGLYYGLAWANDSQTVFFTTVDDAHRPYRLHRYQLGADPSEAEVLYTEEDERFHLSVKRTRSGKYIVMTLESALTIEQWVLDGDDPSGELRVVAPRRQGVEYRLEHHGERFFILTNQSDTEGGAVNFRMVEAPVESPGFEHWVEVIPPRPDVQLVGLDAFADHLVIWERAEGLPQIRVRELSTGDEHFVDFPEATYDVYSGINMVFDTALLRFRYTSLVTPKSFFDYDLSTHERTLLKEQPVPGYDRAQYVTERLVATAEDGAEVPVSLVYRRGLERDGTNPTFLRGYGAYGWPYDVYFNSNALGLLDRGVVVAIAHVRGGGEMGRPWHDDGKLLNKRNTFTDFIAVAEHLIAEDYTSSDRLAIYGASAGGLLIGAVTNMRPDLFGVVVADVPFVDVLNTMSDETIPLTVIEWEEWGNPNDTEYFDYIRSYSPYDNVQAVEYPHILITAGLNDPRVAYWEPAKLTARLRATATSDNWLLLRTNMGAGHFGASGRYGRLEELAFIYAFVLDRLGLLDGES